VRSLRHDDLIARQIAARAVIGANHRHPGELAVCAGQRTERDAAHSGNGLEHFLQLVHAGQEPLAMRHRRQRMAAGELRQQCGGIAGARVVLHGAGAERIEVRIDREIQLRQARVVAHRIELTDLGQLRPRAALKAGRYALGRRAGRQWRPLAARPAPGP